MAEIKPPAFGSPCNGCGLCCKLEVCRIGKMVFGEAQAAPCPALEKEDGRYWCGIVRAEEKAGLPKMAADALGVGKGCDSEFYPWEIKEAGLE